MDPEAGQKSHGQDYCMAGPDPAEGWCLCQGYPGKPITNRHLQATSGILYGVFKEYDPENLLLAQAQEESLTMQMEHDRLIEAVKRINNQKIILKYTNRFTPFAFPIMVDRLRATLSSESLEDRVLKMQERLVK